MLTRELAESLIRLPKALAGLPKWSRSTLPRGKTESDPTSPWYTLAATLAVDGQPMPGLELRANAHPHHEPQRLQMLLQVGAVVLERVSLRPTHFHTNKVPGRPRTRLPPGIPRRYSILTDPRWPPSRGGPELGEMIIEPLDSAEALIRYCLSAWAIDGDLPAPPFSPELPL